MSESMIEKVAQAIGHLKITSTNVSDTASIRDLLVGVSEMVGHPWDEESFDDSMRQMARAAIEAMMEPTEEMVRAGNPHAGVSSSSARRTFQAMLKEALK